MGLETDDRVFRKASSSDGDELESARILNEEVRQKRELSEKLSDQTTSSSND